MLLEAWRPDTQPEAKPEEVSFQNDFDIDILLSDSEATDRATAEAWLKWINFEFVYNCNNENWYKWNGKFWERDLIEEHKASLLDYTKDLKKRAVKGKAESDPERTKQNRILKIALKLENEKTWKGHFSASAVLNNRIDFNIDGDLINLNNGTFDIAKMEFRKHSKEDFISYCLPFDYSPEEDCPNWISFLNDIFLNHNDLIHYIHKAVGYSLTAKTSEQCLFFLYGTGQNGKSTFIETLLLIFGEFGLKIPLTALLYNKNNNEASQREIIRLKGKRLAIANEVNENDHLSESIIKDLTGGDTLTGRELYEKTAEFEASHKFWIYGNHKPIIKGSDLGIWRRIRLIPFLYTVPKHKKDGNLKDKLKNELSGIFNWIIDGLKLWREDLEKNDYSSGLEPIPEDIENATAEYKNEMDLIGLFISDYCDLSGECDQKNLYKQFKLWQEETGNLSRITSNKLTKKLKEKGFEYYSGTGNKTTWKNLSLKEVLWS